MRISIIVAVAENGVIGRGGELPWRLSADLQRFKRLTLGHTIIMGRRTWESIGRPLPGRRTVIVTRQIDYRVEFPDVTVVPSLRTALEAAAETSDAETFVIGGAELFREALPQAQRLYYTRVLANVDGDTRFPQVDWGAWRKVESELTHANEKNDYPTRFEIYERV
jgi:dihydrofolate reductase